MPDMKSSLKLPLILSIVGIFLLFFISNNLSKPISVELNAISSQHFNKTLSINGVVASEKHFPKYSLFIIRHPIANKTLEVICFCQRTYLNKTIEAIGILEVYNNKTQLLADRIRII